MSQVKGLPATSMLRLTLVQPDDEAEPEVTEFKFDAPGDEGFVIGRSDVGSSYVPDVDLAPCNAQRYGISRRHAVLVRYHGVVHVIDLGSMNGTFINGKRLSPQTAYPLNDGDQVSLANLSFQIARLETQQ